MNLYLGIWKTCKRFPRSRSFQRQKVESLDEKDDNKDDNIFVLLLYSLVM